MAFRLSDEETEKLILSRELITPERLSPFRVQCSVDSAFLFDLMVSEGVITPELLAELEKAAPPPAAPRSIRPGGGTSFLQQKPAEAAASSTPGGGAAAAALRRPSRTRMFEEMPAAPKAGGSAIQAGVGVIAPAPSGVFQSEAVEPVRRGAEAETSRKIPQGWPGGMAPADNSPGHIQHWLNQARQQGASDIYLSGGSAPMLRVHGALSPMANQPALSSEQLAGIVRGLLTRQQLEYVDRHADLCCAYAFGGGGRYRITVVKHRGGYEVAARVVAAQISSAEQLGLPPSAAKLAQFSEGLILFCGPANSGKTTSMMATVEIINQSRSGHIITLEDPIEYVLTAQKCQVTQREIGAHAANFESALHSSLREDPDLIVIGELRDHNTTQVALAAAEAGHLVFATVPAADCARALDRIFESPEDPVQIRNRVADSLRAVFSQQMVPRADGQGRVMACELLINSISVANIIREAKTQSLVNVMQSGRQQGMIMMDDSLRVLVEDGVIDGAEAYARCKNKPAFKQYLPEPEKPPEAPKAPEPQKTAAPQVRR